MPVVIGAGGVEKIVEIELNADGEGGVRQILRRGARTDRGLEKADRLRRRDEHPRIPGQGTAEALRRRSAGRPCRLDPGRGRGGRREAARPGLCGEVADPRRRPRRRALRRRSERQGRRAPGALARRGAGGRRGDDRPHAGHQADRPARPAGQPGLCRGRLRHRPRTVSFAAGRSRHRPGHHGRLDRRRHGDRGGRGAAIRRRSCASAIDPATGISGFHARRLAFGLGLDRQAGRRVRQVRRRRCTQAFTSARLRDRRDQPAGRHRRRRGRRAGCQGQLRRQRAVPPSGTGKAARRGGGGPEGAGGRQVRA